MKRTNYQNTRKKGEEEEGEKADRPREEKLKKNVDILHNRKKRKQNGTKKRENCLKNIQLIPPPRVLRRFKERKINNLVNI